MDYQTQDEKPGVIKRKQELVQARESGDVQQIQQKKAALKRLMTALGQTYNEKSEFSDAT